MYLNAVLLVRGYTLSNCIDQHKTWPTSLNYFTIVSFCNVLDSSVLFCSSFDYSSLNSSVLWHIVLGCCTDYRTAIKQKTWPTILNYSRNVSYYSFLDCGVLYVDALLCSALDCVTALHLTAVYLKELYRLSDCLEQPNTWPTSLNYSTIIFYCSVLYFDILLCSTLDCSALKCIAHKYAHIVQHNI